MKAPKAIPTAHTQKNHIVHKCVVMFDILRIFISSRSLAMFETNARIFSVVTWILI